MCSTAHTHLGKKLIQFQCPNVFVIFRACVKIQPYYLTSLVFRVVRYINQQHQITNTQVSIMVKLNQKSDHNKSK